MSELTEVTSLAFAAGVLDDGSNYPLSSVILLAEGTPVALGRFGVSVTIALDGPAGDRTFNIRARFQAPHLTDDVAWPEATAETPDARTITVSYQLPHLGIAKAGEYRFDVFAGDRPLGGGAFSAKIGEGDVDLVFASMLQDPPSPRSDTNERLRAILPFTLWQESAFGGFFNAQLWYNEGTDEGQIPYRVSLQAPYAGDYGRLSNTYQFTASIHHAHDAYLAELGISPTSAGATRGNLWLGPPPRPARITLLPREGSSSAW